VGEGFVDGLKVLEAAWAGEGVEEAGAGWGTGDGAGVGVKKGASGGIDSKDAGGPDEEPLGVLNAMAGAAEEGGDAEIEKRLEEGGGEGEGMGWKSHNNHKTATLTLNDARGSLAKRAIMGWLWISRRALAKALGEGGPWSYGGSRGRFKALEMIGASVVICL
jgi:hypothetical protein